MSLDLIFWSLWFSLVFLALSLICEGLFERKQWDISISFAKLALNVGPTLGLLGTLVAFLDNKNLLTQVLTSKDTGKLITIFLSAWNTTVIGIIIALISTFILHFLDKEDSDET